MLEQGADCTACSSPAEDPALEQVTQDLPGEESSHIRHPLDQQELLVYLPIPENKARPDLDNLLDLLEAPGLGGRGDVGGHRLDVVLEVAEGVHEPVVAHVLVSPGEDHGAIVLEALEELEEGRELLDTGQAAELVEGLDLARSSQDGFSLEFGNIHLVDQAVDD